MSAKSKLSNLRIVVSIAFALSMLSPVLAQQQTITLPGGQTIQVQAGQVITAAQLTPAATAEAADESEEAGTAEAAEPAKPAKEMTEEEKKKAEEAKAEAKRKKEEAANLKKIAKLKFDRRPSEMLKKWSNPNGDEEEEDVDEKKKKEEEEKKKAEEEAAKKKDEPEKELTEEEKKKKEEEEKKKAEAEADKKRAEEFDQSLEEYQRAVTIGDWAHVKKFTAELPEKQGQALYDQLLKSLTAKAPVSMDQLLAATGTVNEAQQKQLQTLLTNSQGSAGKRYAEKHVLSLTDLTGLIDASPGELKDTHLNQLSALLRSALGAGNVLEEFLITCREKDDEFLTDRQVAKLLHSCSKKIEMVEFLPEMQKAIEDDDREGLDLLSEHYLALYARDKKMTQLEKAWEVNQAVLADGKLKKAKKLVALNRAVELAPKVREEFGEEWLNESFTNRPERGKEILATIGTMTATKLSQSPRNAEVRLRGLKLQKTAVDALIKAAPERADEWKETLQLLAFNWLQEAQVSVKYAKSSSMSNQMQRDSFGNIYYIGRSYSYSRSSSQPAGIEVVDVLENKPEGKWLELIEQSIRPKYDMVFSQLYLKVNEEETAFPYIEKLSETYPDKGKELAEEFLRVWTKNHNPNEAKDRTNYYMYIYGYERKAERIPLTRSKQERNLQELASWVKRLKKLPFELDEKLLVRAFTTSHSTAEVYRLPAIENVFGSIGELESETLAEMIQQMRVNLAGVWRKPDTQQRSGTKRKKQDIQLEVTRGYAVANNVLDDAIKKYPDEWRLTLAKAAIIHDENDYQQSIQKRSEYSSVRGKAMEMYAKAAGQYAKAVPDLPENEQSNNVYDVWFYSALGAADLGRVNQDTVADMKQIPMIRDAIAGLPGEAAQNHLDRFANALFTRMSSVNPACKFRYLKGGFEIVGDHKQAHEARKVWDYYHDLVTEIKLESVIDGSDVVGHEEPFGVFVNVRHTKEIERESGGFGKYLQNQNNSYYFSYNYGRPTENYRDKFEEAVRKALEEQFEILSVTFNHAETQSKAVKPYGWRVTPYCHLMLKARGPEVDKLPPMQLDLDFLDTSGYVVLPIESAAVPLDCSKGEPRPYKDLQLVQSLDERQAADGKLVLEVKATAHGLIPPLDKIADVESEGFEIDSIDDQGVVVKEYDKESKDVEILTERLWTVSFTAAEDLAAKPTEFTFAEPTADEDVEVVYQRFVDADLAEVEPTVSLEQEYGEVKTYPLWTIGIGSLIVLGCMALMPVLKKPTTKKVVEDEFALPEKVTPFTVLSLLKNIRQNNGIPQSDLDRLSGDINRLEKHFFVEPESSEPNLEEIAKEWLGKRSKRRNGKKAGRG